MAERSITTRRANMNLYTPQQTAAPAQAIQRGMAQLSSSMDRMSQFFAQQANIEAQIEGAEYGAQNAPTAEQLRDAFQSGEELELPGGTGTVFDRAARKAALDITQTEVEFEARKRINEILTNAELNSTNPATILDDIDAVTHGFAATFDETSPGVSRKLRAGLSIWANGKYSQYENSYIAEQKTRSQSNWISNQLGMFEGLATIIEKGLETTDANGKKTYRPLTPSDMTNLKLGRMQEMTRQDFAPSSVTAYGNLFDREIVEAANIVLINSVLIGEDPQEAITAIGQGKVTGLDIGTQNAVATLRGQNVPFADIAQELRTRRINELRFAEEEETALNSEAEANEEIFLGRAMEAANSGDTAAFEAAVELIKSSDPVKAEDIRAKYAAGGNRRLISDSDTINYLNSLQSDISFPQVLDAIPRLSLADQRKYYQDAKTYQSAAVKDALTIMKGALSLPANIDAIDDADPNFEKVQIFADWLANLPAKQQWRSLPI